MMILATQTERVQICVVSRDLICRIRCKDEVPYT